MHIPDGFLNTATAVTTYVVSAGGVGYSIKEANRKLGDRHVPLMGVMGAFIFAAQMLNFPVIGGTSGHLIGGALAAILLGPWAGTLIMACVLIVQCLVFQDGGITALGANVFNMGLVACFAGYYLYRAVVVIMGESQRSRLVGGFAGAWASVFIASIACAIELAVSGRSPLEVALPAMAGVHALIGIGEGLITSAALAFVAATRADLLELQKV
jgi:cobalt/nickel transport system permease protein